MSEVDAAAENISKLKVQKSVDSSTSRASSSDRASPASNASGLSHSNVKITALSEKRQQREHKRVEQLLSALSSITSPEDKLHAICQKHAALMEENLVMQKTIKETQNMYADVIREKDETEEDMKKLLLTKLKLETLCRELQKQNKAVKAEHLERLRHDEQNRKQLSAQVQGSLDEIHQQMASGKERSDRLAQENIGLMKKIQALSEQCEAREDHTAKLLASHDIEKQLYDAKLKTAVLQGEKIKEEKIKMEHELLLTLQKRDEELKEAMETETALREQMHKYTHKYDELHSSLAESNTTFHTFKKEMQQVNSNLARLERESRQWKKRYEEANNMCVVNMATIQELKANNQMLNQKFTKLEQITRALQLDRTKLREMLKITDTSDANEGDSNGNNDESSESTANANISSSSSCVAAN